MEPALAHALLGGRSLLLRLSPAPTCEHTSQVPNSSLVDGFPGSSTGRGAREEGLREKSEGTPATRPAGPNDHGHLPSPNEVENVLAAVVNRFARRGSGGPGSLNPKLTPASASRLTYPVSFRSVNGWGLQTQLEVVFSKEKSVFWCRRVRKRSSPDGSLPQSQTHLP